MKEKTCVLILDNSPHLGGGELYQIELAEMLNGNEFRFIFALTCETRREYLNKRGLESVLFSSGKLKIKNLFAAFFNLCSGVIQLVKMAKRNEVDIIQANTVRTHILSAVVSVFTKIPVIWVHHLFDFPPWLFRIFSAIPKKIICVSKTVMNHYGMAIADKSKLCIIYNGIDFKKIPSKSQNSFFKKYSPAASPEIKIGTVGRIENLKGQEYFIKSIPAVLEKIKNCRFFIIGEPGPGAEKYNEYIKKLIKELGISEKIVFTGFIEERYEAISDLDIIVQASVEPETFGRVIIEGMSLGKPVIATHIGAFCEIIENGLDGILVPPRDPVLLSAAIIKLAQDREYAHFLGSNGKRKVLETYNMSRTANAYRELYRNLICKNHSTST